MANNADTTAIFSQEAEEAVIGSVLIAPHLFSVIAAQLQADDFFVLRHRYIWEALTRMAGRGEPADFLTAQEDLKAAGKLADVGGASYLLNLINNTPTSVNAEVYAGLVKRAAVRRQVLRAADAIKALATDGALATDDVLDRALDELNAVSTLAVREFRGMSAIVDAHMERTERAMDKPGLLAGVPSVLPGLGKLLGGYQPGRLYYVAARPGMGKTAYLVSEALHMAQAGKTVAIASLEMSESDLTDAMIAALAGVPVKAIQEGTLTPAQYSEYVKAAGKLGRLPIFIEDDAEMTPRQLAGKARKLQYTRGLDVIMVDYVQLMEPTNGGRRYDSEYAEVTANSKALARLAKKLNVPVIAAAQLNREADNRADKRPQMSDLRSSGQLEQDAAVIMFPFRPSFYEHSDGPSPSFEEAEIGIAKNRFGPTGIVRCAFRPVLKQFVPTHTINLTEIAEGKSA